MTALIRVLLLLGLFSVAQAQQSGEEEEEDKGLPSIASKTEGLEHLPGFVPIWHQTDTATTLIEINPDNQELLYVTALPAGVGANDLGLDRGQLKSSRLVRFERRGPRSLMVQPNLDFRAYSDNRMEQRAVSEAFARSVLAGFEVVAQSEERYLIDVSPLLLTDSHGIANRLKQTEQGEYSLDKDRSAPALEQFRGFEDNSVLEAWVTFSGKEPGTIIRSVTPTADSLTVRLRHNFVRLPSNDFERRPYHPRAGYFSLGYRDYAAALNEPIDQQVLVRHRLRNADGTVKPLIYYVDPGAPEPVRSALVEGASWWAQAFAAAGFAGGFEVRILPEDIDPLDVRYNVIQWIHRSTRGWSYGASIVDPRSGQIIKGHISLGSLRVRQDMLIASSLLDPERYTPKQAAAMAETLALARLRQLSAHEVGHTLGLAHNFAASNLNDASVMDYPHPFIRLDTDGQIDLSRAYDSDIGEWDKLAIRYGYSEFSNNDTETSLKQIIAEADGSGIAFISDPDSRGPGSIHADAHLWDNGSDVIDRLTELTTIRRMALDHLSTRQLRDNQAAFELEAHLVPMYLLHRYQAEAVSKLIGGIRYNYALAGDAAPTWSPVSAEQQQQAINALLDLLSDEQLSLSDTLIYNLVPPAYGSNRDREYFTHQTGRAFDQSAPARALAQLVGNLLLEPDRLNRLAQTHRLDNGQPSVSALLEQYSNQTLMIDPNQSMSDSVAWVSLNQLFRTHQDPRCADPVRALVHSELTRLARTLGRRGPQAALKDSIRRYLESPSDYVLPAAVTVPPGSPI